MIFSTRLVKIGSGDSYVFATSNETLEIYNIKNGKARKKIISFNDGSFSLGNVQEKISADEIARVDNILVVRKDKEFFIN